VFELREDQMALLKVKAETIDYREKNEDIMNILQISIFQSINAEKRL